MNNQLLTILHASTKLHSVRALRYLFRNFQIPVSILLTLDESSPLPLPPLHYAAQNGLLQILRLVLKRITEEEDSDALVNQPFNGVPPVLYALRSRCVHCVVALLDAGADANLHCANGMTPLRYAVEECSNYELIQALIDYDAEPELSTDRFGSPKAYVQSRLEPCTDASEREHWETILESFLFDCEELNI